MTIEKDTKVLLLQAAARIFAKRGYDGATVKEIADEAGVNVSLVSYHFEGKENLYHLCLSRFAENKVELAERILRPAETFEDLKARLSLFAEEMLLDAVNEPDVCMILHRDCVGANPILKDLYKGTFLKNYEIFLRFLEAAQRKKILRGGIAIDLYAIQFMGGLVHNMRIDPLREEISGESIRQSKFRDKLIKNAVEMFLHGAKVAD